MPCIVEVFTGKTSQYLKILRRIHNKGDANKANREQIWASSQIKKLSLSQIEKMTGFTVRELRDYYYKPTVPKVFINYHTTVKTLNYISSLDIDSDVKSYLYRCAGHPRGSSKRLTEEKRKLLQEFFEQAKRFEQLNNTEKIKVLRCVLSFKEFFMGFLQIRIDSFLD